MVETAVLICMCVHKNVRQRERETETQRGEKNVLQPVCGVKLVLSSDQYFGTLV